jgi:GAF domain-containing protein
VEVASGFSAADVVGERFAGSAGAIQRVLQTGTSVVVSNAQTDALLGKRRAWSRWRSHPGLRPLAPGRRDRGHDLRGRPEARRGIRPTDLEILESLAEHVAIVVASLRLDRKMQTLLRRSAMAHAAHSPALLEDLQRQIVDSVKAPAI